MLFLNKSNLCTTTRYQTTLRILKFLQVDQGVPVNLPVIAAKMIQNLNPEASPTYRKGKIGGWRDEMDQELINLFKEKTGNLLQKLNYDTW